MVSLLPLDHIRQLLSIVRFENLAEFLEVQPRELFGQLAVAAQDRVCDPIMNVNRRLPIACPKRRSDVMPLDYYQRARIEVEHVISARSVHGEMKPN